MQTPLSARPPDSQRSGLPLPHLHPPREGELRGSHREAVVSGLRAPRARRAGDPVGPLPPQGSAHLQQRHELLAPESRPLSQEEVKAKAAARRGGNQNFFHIPLPFPSRGQGVPAPGVSCGGGHPALPPPGPGKARDWAAGRKGREPLPEPAGRASSGRAEGYPAGPTVPTGRLEVCAGKGAGAVSRRSASCAWGRCSHQRPVIQPRDGQGRPGRGNPGQLQGAGQPRGPACEGAAPRRGRGLRLVQVLHRAPRGSTVSPTRAHRRNEPFLPAPLAGLQLL